MNAARALAVAQKAAEQSTVEANQKKLVAETMAQQELEVARIARQAAEEDAKKQIVLAQAKKESIALGGAITEKERVLAEIEKEKAIGVAAQLSKIAVPNTIIAGGGAQPGQTGGNVQENLINLSLMKSLGVIK